MKNTFYTASAAALLMLSGCAQPTETEATPVVEGAWTVDPDASSLSYVSVKSGEVAEANEFTALSGSVSAAGEAEIVIDLASVSTGVDIRDERMRDIFFNVADNPTASVTAQLDPAAFEALGLGESLTQTLDATLNVKGVEAPIQTQVAVTRVADDRVLAVSSDPVIVYADALELSEGLATLQELAGLDAITPAVPVTFSIMFER
ncbi:MAG: YceI family protein [Pseudomonadota bacterium]